VQRSTGFVSDTYLRRVTPVSVIEAVEWREPAPNGGSQGQVFRLTDGRFAIVKFPENGQGEFVLANDFLSCRLAAHLDLPINLSELVSIDERLLRLPRQNGQIPPTFSAGIRCGMMRFEHPEGADPSAIAQFCSNAAELHAVAVFEQLVSRGDGRQLLMYPVPGSSTAEKRFGAFDYGYAFGGQPQWSAATLVGMPAPLLPPLDPFTNQPYANGDPLTSIIDKLRTITATEVERILAELNAPRWGVLPADLAVLAGVLDQRAQALVAEFDRRYKQQLRVL
jgi:hypothetical protein